MKPQIIAFTLHDAGTLRSLIKQAKDAGQEVTKERAFVAFNPSEAMGIDMTPKAKPIRDMTLREQLTDAPPTVPGSLEDILSRVDMGEG